MAKHILIPGVKHDVADSKKPWQSMHGRQPKTTAQRQARQAARQVVDLTTPVNCEGCAGCVPGTPCPLEFRRG